MGNCLSSPPVKPTAPSQRSCSPGHASSKTCSTATATAAAAAASLKPSTEAGEAFRKGEKPNLRVYTLTELKRATANFSPQQLIGEGEFGMAFKGWVDGVTLKPAMCGCGVPVAVKRYQLENMQGLEEWKSEVKILGSLSHPNVVKLLGYCRTDSQLLLVYEFMPLGNLERHLFAKGSSRTLPWRLRLKIAIGVAQGLVALHTLEEQVIHRNIKTSNILLDSDYNAKISDFGLATNGPTDASHVTTRLKGTFAYAAPEYVATGHLYPKSDVYGFGVVLLEMISGQRAYDASRPRGEQYLVKWAKPFLADHARIARVVDARLDGQYPSKGALHLGQLVLRCLDNNRKTRPPMERVLQTLGQIEAMDTSRPGRDVGGSGSPACNILHTGVPHCLPLPPSTTSGAARSY